MSGDGKEEEDGEGLALWRYVLKNVTPLDKTKNTDFSAYALEEDDEHEPGAGAMASVPAPVLKKNRNESRDGLSKRGGTAEERLPGLDRRSEQRLRQGKMAIDATLDLHGMSKTAAYDRLKDFIVVGYDRGWRCVLVVTGKGTRSRSLTAEEDETHWFFNKERPGVLRRSVPGWLTKGSLGEMVLRVVPAKKQHGGAGAFYVLIRRKR